MLGTLRLALLLACAVPRAASLPRNVPPEPAPRAAALGPFAALTSPDAVRRALQEGAGCGDVMAGIGADLNDQCCNDAKAHCEDGAPHTCSRPCATLWMPFQKECSIWLLENFPEWYASFAPLRSCSACLWKRRWLSLGRGLGPTGEC